MTSYSLIYFILWTLTVCCLWAVFILADGCVSFVFGLFLQSSVCEKIMELLGQNKIDHHQRQVVILSQDSFYKVLTPEQKAKAVKGQFNFDHPGMKTLYSL